jgi:formamidopyrimidine-DNA glycosylase
MPDTGRLMAYRYSLDQAVDDVLATVPRREATSLRDFFRFLAQHPATAGELRVTDRDGRPCDVRVHGRFVVTYRQDHAAREVRIVAVEIG